jgi:hypothetical protein
MDSLVININLKDRTFSTKAHILTNLPHDLRQLADAIESGKLHITAVRDHDYQTVNGTVIVRGNE